LLRAQLIPYAQPAEPTPPQEDDSKENDDKKRKRDSDLPSGTSWHSIHFYILKILKPFLFSYKFISLIDGRNNNLSCVVNQTCRKLKLSVKEDIQKPRCYNNIRRCQTKNPEQALKKKFGLKKAKLILNSLMVLIKIRL